VSDTRCFPLATRAGDMLFSPFLMAILPTMKLATPATTIRTIPIPRSVMSWGCRMASRDSTIIITPAMVIMAPSTMADTSSTLPWPKGWLASAGWREM